MTGKWLPGWLGPVTLESTRKRKNEPPAGTSVVPWTTAPGAVWHLTGQPKARGSAKTSIREKRDEMATATRGSGWPSSQPSDPKRIESVSLGEWLESSAEPPQSFRRVTLAHADEP